MKSTNKISLRHIDKPAFTTIDSIKTQIMAPTALNPLKSKSSTKYKEMLKKIKVEKVGMKKDKN